MQGEKIDIIPWSPDLATFVVNALQPATVSRVVIDEEESRIEVVVPDDQLSLAIGRRGQNVRLASQLSGSAIDIMTEADASEKRQREFVERSEMFQNELDVDETLAQLLVAEGFGALEEVAYVELDELASIEGFDDELGAELQSRALEALERREEASREERRGLGVSDELAEMPYLTEAMLVTLGKAASRRSTISPISPLTSSSRRSGPSSAASARATGPRTRAASSPTTASRTSRATRSSWPPAPTGSRTKSPRLGRARLRNPPNDFVAEVPEFVRPERSRGAYAMTLCQHPRLRSGRTGEAAWLIGEITSPSGNASFRGSTMRPMR
jgi:transcription termination factor NusA